MIFIAFFMSLYLRHYFYLPLLGALAAFVLESAACAFGARKMIELAVKAATPIFFIAFSLFIFASLSGFPLF
mgnify:CR=1 FL=1